MKLIIFLPFILLSIFSCQSQTAQHHNKRVGGPCEGCEAIREYGPKPLKSSTTLPLFEVTEPKLKITGTVYKNDGQTPAKDIILYIYQTNREGIYEKKGNEQGWAKKHGFIRGWVKTDGDGRYTFYTFRPATYPNTQEPAHIHIIVKEPDQNEYYLDSYVFDDDPLLTASERQSLANRGGSGITQAMMKDGMLTITRDLILGLNIPDYD